VLTGLNTMADAMESNLLTFVSLCAAAEWGLSNAQVATLAAVIFMGEIFGALFWGPWADRHGRRSGFLWSTGGMFLFGGMYCALRTAHCTYVHVVSHISLSLSHSFSGQRA